VLLVCTVYSVLYSEIALSRKPFGIGHTYIYMVIFLIRMTDTMTFQNIYLSSWDTLYAICTVCASVKHAKLYAYCGDVQSYSPSGKHCLRRPGIELTATVVGKTLHSKLVVIKMT
jgi:hypothetical protein